MENFQDYLKYRWFFTSSGKLVVGGKNAAQNDELLSRVKKTNKDYVVMHTSAPGSPFCVILAEKNKVSKKDTKECSIFTGCFSKSWKEQKKNISVDIFHASQLNKNEVMKTGTWGVKGKVERVVVPLILCLTRQKGVLRAVPRESIKTKSAELLIVQPGKIDKKDMLAKIEIELNEPLSREEVLAALPAGGLSVCRE